MCAPWERCCVISFSFVLFVPSYMFIWWVRLALRGISILFPEHNEEPVCHCQVFLLLVRRGSELIGVSAQIDSGIRILAFLIYPTISYCAYFWCTCLWHFQVLLLLVRRGSELIGVSAQIDSGIRILAFLIYPTISYCAYFWCTCLWHFQVLLLLVRRGSGLFGVSTQTVNYYYYYYY